MITKEIIDVYVDGGTVERENKTFILKQEFGRFFNLKEAERHFEMLKKKGFEPIKDVKKGKNINFTNLY